MPFTVEQFFNIFLGYNTSVFPFQIILFLAGIFSLSLIIFKSKYAGKFTSYLLVILWLWNGIVYHIYFFSKINKAAIAFGTLFILQAVFFLIEFVIKKKLDFTYDRKFDMLTGYFLILFGLIIYPVIGLIPGKEIGYIISFGLPCPSVIFTFGIIIASRKNYTLYKLIIPVIWAFIGFFAALKFGVYQDVALPVSAVIAIILFFKERNILIPF
jgi:hypothetical protein